MKENYIHQYHPTYKRNIFAMTILSTIFFGWAVFAIHSTEYFFLTVLLVGAGAILFLGNIFYPNAQLASADLSHAILTPKFNSAAILAKLSGTQNSRHQMTNLTWPIGVWLCMVRLNKY